MAYIIGKLSDYEINQFLDNNEEIEILEPDKLIGLFGYQNYVEETRIATELGDKDRWVMVYADADVTDLLEHGVIS